METFHGYIILLKHNLKIYYIIVVIVMYKHNVSYVWSFETNTVESIISFYFYVGSWIKLETMY